MRFSVGEEVWYHGKPAKVVACFYESPGQPRYYVDQKGQRWSAPEWAVFKSNKTHIQTPNLPAIDS